MAPEAPVRPAKDTPGEPRPAATIVLVRPAPDGLEVLLTRRPDSMAFAAGLHVFPGGRVESADAGPRLVARARGSRAEAAFRVAHRIAAIRETWEEVGVLLADGPTGRDADRSVARPRPGETFEALVTRLDLALRTDDLVEIAHWTTPRSMDRRFDARFFVAELPPGVAIRPDAREVADHTWLTPRAALAAMAAGAIGMWPPTSTTLQRLERATTFAAIRTGLAIAPEPPIGTRRVAAGLRVMTGQSAFGPEGRPANTVLVGEREVVVVDPGDPGEAFLDAVEAEVARLGGRVVAIALTHVDPGHAAGSEDLSERTGAPILVGPGGAAQLSWPATAIDDGAIVGQEDATMTAAGDARPPTRPPRLPDRRRDPDRRRRADRSPDAHPAARGRRGRPQDDP